MINKPSIYSLTPQKLHRKKNGRLICEHINYAQFKQKSVSQSQLISKALPPPPRLLSASDLSHSLRKPINKTLHGGVKKSSSAPARLNEKRTIGDTQFFDSKTDYTDPLLEFEAMEIPKLTQKQNQKIDAFMQNLSVIRKHL